MSPQQSQPSESMAEAVRELLRRQQPRGRREIADALCDQLSPWELLELRRRLNVMTLDQRAFASWADLPAETIYDISSYLSLHDLLACRLVSRTWRKTWLMDGCLTRLLSKMFPGVMESSPADVPKEDLLVRTLFSYRSKGVDGFRGAFIPWCTREALQTGTTTRGAPVYQLALGLGYDEHAELVSSGPLYDSGKVAWELPGARFSVDDIGAARRVIYTLPMDRRKPVPVLKMVALTGKMLVVHSSAHPAPEILHMLHLEREEWSSITLSARLSTCYANDESLVAICGTRGGVHWSWGRKCVDIDTAGDDHTDITPEPDRMRVPGGTTGALFHPYRADVIFLVHLYEHQPPVPPPENDGKLFTAVVTRYEQRGTNQPFAAAHRHLQVIHRPHRTEMKKCLRLDSYRWLLMVSPSMYRINSHGSYSLFYLDHSHRFTGNDIHFTTVLCFNVLTETFSSPGLTVPAPPRGHQYHPEHRTLNPSLRVADQVHIWNGEFLTLVWGGVDAQLGLPPSLSSTALMDQDVMSMEERIRRRKGAAPANATPVEHVAAPEGGASRLEPQGSAIWVLCADDSLLLVMSDHGYHIVKCRQDETGQFAWLRGALDQPILTGWSFLGPVSLRADQDVYFHMTHRGCYNGTTTWWMDNPEHDSTPTESDEDESDDGIMSD